jgi:hypothetical protein
MIVAGPEILAELGLNAAIVNNVLVIVGRGCRLRVSARRFQSVAFPGLGCIEARLIRRGEGEVIINRTVIVPIRGACSGNARGCATLDDRANGRASGMRRAQSRRC